MISVTEASSTCHVHFCCYSLFIRSWARTEFSPCEWFCSYVCLYGSCEHGQGGACEGIVSYFPSGIRDGRHVRDPVNQR
jgi:hypothetical protein